MGKFQLTVKGGLLGSTIKCGPTNTRTELNSDDTPKISKDHQNDHGCFSESMGLFLAIYRAFVQLFYSSCFLSPTAEFNETTAGTTF
jgi:hypothetical protein